MTHPDSLDAIILDWIILGRITGARKNEWCQNSLTVKLSDPTLPNIPQQQQPLAFLFSNFTFQDHHGRIFRTIDSTSFASAASVTIEWRFQKNTTNNNGDKMPFAHDSKRPSICPVQTTLRICLRAKRSSLPADAPPAIFHPTTSTTSEYLYITSNHVTAPQRWSAQALLGIKPTDPML
jgi:hypothetical protein